MAEQRFPVDGPHSGLVLVVAGSGVFLEDQVHAFTVCLAAGENMDAQLVDLAEAVSKVLAFLKGGARG